MLWEGVLLEFAGTIFAILGALFTYYIIVPWWRRRELLEDIAGVLRDCRDLGLNKLRNPRKEPDEFDLERAKMLRTDLFSYYSELIRLTSKRTVLQRLFHKGLESGKGCPAYYRTVIVCSELSGLANDASGEKWADWSYMSDLIEDVRSL